MSAPAPDPYGPPTSHARQGAVATVPRAHVAGAHGAAPQGSRPRAATAGGTPSTGAGPLAGVGSDLIITGEAVALELRPASVLTRILSGLIDLFVYGMFGSAILMASTLLITNQARMAVVAVTSIVVATIILPTAVETITRGLSAGKIATGIRVVREDGGPVRLRQAFVRALTGVGEIWLCVGSIAVITAIVNKRSMRLGDLLAGTYAVRVRGAEIAVAPLLMPPDLDAWAKRADIRRLPDHLALHARIFLSRTGQLAPTIRADMGTRFAATIEPYVSPPPPWGTNPERFVAAVLVERRDREYAAGLAARDRDAAQAATMRRLPYGI